MTRRRDGSQYLGTCANFRRMSEIDHRGTARLDYGNTHEPLRIL